MQGALRTQRLSTFFTCTLNTLFSINAKMIKNLTTNVLILIYILFFLFPVYRLIFLCVWFSENQRKAQENKTGGEVTARLDTFGLIFYSIFPYLIFFRLFFFILPVSSFRCLFRYYWGAIIKRNKQRKVGGSRGKAWHICGKIFLV